MVGSQDSGYLWDMEGLEEGLWGEGDTNNICFLICTLVSQMCFTN